MNKKGGELICMRPDVIVEARFKLTKKQNDIMDMVFASIEDDEKLEYEIDVNKYAKLYNVKDTSDIYGELKKAVKTFEGKGFRITSKDKKREDYFSWFSRIAYLNGEGKISVELGKTLKLLLLDVKRAIYYNIEYTLNFNSVYSKRLYFYLKLYEDTGVRFDNVDSLRDKLECPLGYKNFADFNRYVLKPAYEEINANSDISFEYDTKKTGKKISHIKFLIKSNKKINDLKQIKSNEEVSATIEPPLYNLEERISQTMTILNNTVEPSEALSICGSADGDMKLISKAYNYTKTKNVKDIVAYTIDTITRIKHGTFNEPKKASSTSGFNNFKPREYDYDSLERKLLGWDK